MLTTPTLSAPGSATDDVPLPKPLPGFLVASTVATDRGIKWAEQDEVIQSSSSSDEEDAVGDISSISFSRAGAKDVRDSSFRKRDDAKLARAKEIRARSGVLTSHLITPAQHGRSLGSSSVLAQADTTAPKTVGTTPRRLLSDIAEIPDYNPSSGTRRASAGREGSFEARKRNKAKLDRMAAIAVGSKP